MSRVALDVVTLVGHFGSSGSIFCADHRWDTHGSRGHPGGFDGSALRAPLPVDPFLGGHRNRVVLTWLVLPQEGPQTSAQP